MKLDIKDNFSSPNIDRVAKKENRLPYSVTPIHNIAEWKAEQAVKETAYQSRMAPIREARRNAAVELIANNTPTSFSETDKIEIATLKRMDEEAAKVKITSFTLPALPQVKAKQQLWMPETAEPKTLTDRLLARMAKIWKDANFSS